MTQSLGIGLLAALGLCWLGVSARAAKPKAEQPVAAVSASAADACERLNARLCGDFRERDSACRLARAETAQFSDARCSEMLARYDAVKSELGALDEGRGAVRQREQTLLHGNAPSTGAADAAQLWVVFCDFESADCGRIAPLHQMLENLYPGRVRLVFRQYPLPSKHPHAALAAEASLAANDQGKFWEYHDLLFANPHDLGREALERYARAAGLDLARFRRALDEHTFAADVAADIALGHKLQVLQVPAAFADGAPISVPYGVTELAHLLP